MIIGIGTDIMRVDRIAAVLARRGEAFARRILADAEFRAWQSSNRKVAMLAKRYAAKEAALKALGTGLAQGLRWHDLEVGHDELGRPLLRFSGEAARRAERMGATRTHLTVSDEADYVVAFVILESA